MQFSLKSLTLAVISIMILGLLQTALAAEEQDHYKVLGVEKTATLKQIKKAYKQLALKYHPDKVRDSSKKKDAEDKFFKINQAYETLSDPQKKKLYDRQKSSNPNPFTSGFGGHHADFSGFGFESMFFENEGHHRPFHFTQDFSGDNFFPFENLFPEDHNPYYDAHTFGDGSSFFGSHFGGHHESRFAQHHGHHGRAQGSHFSHQFAQTNTGGQRSCRTVTQRIGNTVSTYVQCS